MIASMLRAKIRASDSHYLSGVSPDVTDPDSGHWLAGIRCLKSMNALNGALFVFDL